MSRGSDAEQLPIALARFVPKGDMALYRQVADALRTFIEEAGFEEGGELPTEEALARHYEVSRITVRHALQILEADGLIRKRRAKSCEVLPAQLRRHGPWQVNSLEDIAALTSRGDLKLISYQKEVFAPASEALGTRASEPLFCLTNVLKIDKRPFAYNKIYFPPEIGASLQVSDFTDVAIYRNIENKLSITISDVEANARSVLASADMAQWLLCRPKDPILMLTLLFYNGSQNPVQYSINHYRGDEFVLSYRFRRAPIQAG